MSNNQAFEHVPSIPETAWTIAESRPVLEPASPDSLRRIRVGLTGGTSGLGLALVHLLLDRGARVAFVARSSDGIGAVLKDRPEAYGIKGDISVTDDIYPIALQMMGVLGGLDVLINNASSLGSLPLKLLADTDCEELELALAANVLGPFRLIKALLGALGRSAREGRKPLVINISSDAAINPYAMWGAYGTSKAALHHLSRIWDEELMPHGIRVLSIDPGDMDTPLHALAVPDADRAKLKPPRVAAREIIEQILSTFEIDASSKGPTR